MRVIHDENTAPDAATVERRQDVKDKVRHVARDHDHVGVLVGLDVTGAKEVTLEVDFGTRPPE